MFPPLGLLQPGDTLDLLADHARPVAVGAAQAGFFLAQRVDPRIELPRTSQPPPLPLDAHAAQGRNVAVVLHLTPVERVFLAFEFGDAFVNLAETQVDMLPHAPDVRRREGRTVTAGDHRHVERRGAGRGEDIAVGVHAVGKQAHQRLALADLDVQRSPVGDIGNRFIHESVAGDQSFDTRQVHRINCRAECLDSGM